MPVHSDDKELLKKCRETWNNTTESTGLNNAEIFSKIAESNGDEYIEVDVNKNTNFVKGNHQNRNELIKVLDSIIDGYLKTRLVQYRY